MKIKRQKVPDGWRGEITCDKTEERWFGNISKTIKGAKVQVKSSFVEEKLRRIFAKKKEIKAILAEIEQIKKL